MKMAGLIDAVESRPQTAFAGFLVIHGLVWTVLPSLIYFNLPLDVIEAMVYGREWQLGYDKLPPLPWWVAEAVYRVFGSDDRSTRCPRSPSSSRSSRCGRPRVRWSARPARSLRS